MGRPFRFQQFEVAHDQCAMKVGTDGVLLGAWTDIPPHTSHILDIGTGSGLIALMLAQRRSDATLDAIDIDESAYRQSELNFRMSKWKNNLTVHHCALKDFVASCGIRYELIVCNPPFYAPTYKSKNESRDIARFQDALPYEVLMSDAACILAEGGIFSLIIPYEDEHEMIRVAARHGLYVYKCTRVKGMAHTPIKRSLLSFSFKKIAYQESMLILEEERNVRTPEYQELTKEFYL